MIQLLLYIKRLLWQSDSGLIIKNYLLLWQIPVLVSYLLGYFDWQCIFRTCYNLLFSLSDSNIHSETYSSGKDNMDLPYWVYFSPVCSVLILCTLNPVSCPCIKLLTWFSFGIGYFKCVYPDHVKPICIVLPICIVATLSLTLQPPLSEPLSHMTCIFSLSAFPYCS